MNYYTSDLHFFCPSELRNGYFKERPFETLDEMHSEMKYRWNKKVTNADHVYILGDISMRGYNEKVVSLLSQLKGNLHLISGNHDRIEDFREKRIFSEICDYKEISDSFNGTSYKLVLCHYPIYAWNGQHRGTILLYGHTHDNFDDEMYQNALKDLNAAYQKRDGDKYIPFHAYNVGCMHWNYEPVSLKEILNGTQQMN